MKMKFNATFGQWFVKLLVWGLVTIFTLGIGLMWVQYDMIKWIIGNTEIVK